MINLKIHELKTLPKFFKAQVTGNKQFEVRKNDRDFQVGDILMLQEWDNGYTDAEASVIVTYVLKDFEGLNDGYVVLGTRPVQERDMEDYVNRLEKALDKACYELASTFVHGDDKRYGWDNEEWKQWCLKNE